MKKYHVAAAIAIYGSCAAAVAADAATIYTDRSAFEAAVFGLVTEDFELPFPHILARGHGSTYTGANFTVSGSNMFVVDPAFDPIYRWNSGDVLELDFDPATITANANVRAIGFDYGNPAAYFGTGLVTINGVDYALVGQPVFNFFGIVDDMPIASVSINWNGGLGIIDNVSAATGMVVPEPATWAMMIGGFGLIGGAMRIRSRAARTAIA